MRKRRLSGLPAFGAVWAGQLLSLVGTGMTRFALTIWAWQMTGQATALALVGFFSFAPMMLLSPVAGALVDRWNRKLTMILSDLAAGVATIVIFVLYMAGELEIWHLCAAGAFSGAFEAFQFPAYRASITMMIPKKHFARATAMIQLAGFGSTILAPIAAGVLIGPIGIGGILSIDIATFVLAMFALIWVVIPSPTPSVDGAAARGSLWRESLFGFRYIFQRPSLIALQSLLLFLNISGTFGFILLAPMILARTGDNSVILGSVQAAFGIGGVVGGVLFSLWGGPKRLIHGALLGCAATSLLGQMMLGIGRGPVLWWTAAFTTTFFAPMLNGCISGIWQKKVPADIQGKVFSVRRMIAEMGRPAAMLMAGPLADRVLEPAMAEGEALSSVFGPLVGTGPGAGMALLLVFTGVLGGLTALAGYAFPVIREVEDLLPDQPVYEEA